MPRGKKTRGGAAKRAGSSKRTRRRYTDEERARILAAANGEGLTAKDVQKRFGVPPITYYSWRKKAGAPKRATNGRKRGRPAGTRIATSTGGALEDALRQQIREQIRQVLPEIIRSEIGNAFSAGAPRRRRRSK